MDPRAYDHPVADIEVIETHISWVLLAGEYAYKIKKPVNPGFLDFTELANRRFFCEEELRLNRRLAPGIYLGVVPIGEQDGKPVIGGSGPVLEYAVHMRRFDQAAQLDRQLQANLLTPYDMHLLADYVARFHDSAAVAAPDTPWGEPEMVRETVMANFQHLDPQQLPAPVAALPDQLRDWTESRYRQLQAAISRRKRDGYVRECHGDLHLRNIARIDDHMVAFDGIEFSESLRWIDILSDAAFLMMDVQSRGRPDLGWNFINRWLAETGDFGGLQLLDWYLVYRHLVRAKVDAIRLDQGSTSASETSSLSQRLIGHLELAASLMNSTTPGLVVVSGVSGSGKSWLAARLSARLPGVWLRSDVERKRIHAGRSARHDETVPSSGLYSPQMTRATYRRLIELAEDVIGFGYHVILDATFLDPAQRDAVWEMARRCGVPHRLLACDAPEEILRARVIERAARHTDPSDADTAVLEAQLKTDRSLTADEEQFVSRVRTDGDLIIDEIAGQLRVALARSRP